jgi:Flp pilus assembly protein TadG
MFAAFKNMQRSFASDEQGSVAIIFAMLLILLTFTAGIAIDTARIYRDKSNISRAVDAATLAAGQAMLDGRNTDAQVKTVALNFFYENLKSSGIKKSDFKNVSVSLDRSTGEVAFSVKSDVEMTLTRVMGHKKMDIPVAAKAVFDQTDIELGMALDITGSMKGRKLNDLKDAANDLLDILMPDGGTSHTIRIGIAPYAASINAGSYAATVSNNTSTDDCVWERSGAQAFTDAAPGAGAYFGGGSAPADIDPTEGTSTYSCPKAAVVPLTDQKTTLSDTIKSLKAKGYTAGHLGAAWASYLVSPEWSSVWPVSSTPVDYTDEDTIKAVIFMTDGIFNTAYANGNSSYQALEVCDSMKDNGVKVYTIGFEAPSGAETTLRSCATTEDHYFNASNGTELQAAFVSIAKQLTNLRLTN